MLGILSTSFGLASSVASKYLIDIITGYQTSKLAVLFLVMVGGQVFSLLFESLINRVSRSLVLILTMIFRRIFLIRLLMRTGWRSVSIAMETF